MSDTTGDATLTNRRQTKTFLNMDGARQINTKQNLSVVPATVLHKMQRQLDVLTEATTVANMISEEEAATLLGINSKTLAKRVSGKKISPELYTVSPINGRRFYNKKKLCGL